jgi:1,4-dihydroxy-2-naphthoate octaprenyltransferase
VLVGGGLAIGDKAFRLDAFLAALLASVAIQVAANYANDVSDARRGADSADRVGPPRMVASGVIDPRWMWWATTAALAVAGLAGAYLYTLVGWPVIVIGLASVLAMLTYVGGPIPYGYRGLGEVAVFVFFGLVATVGSRMVHDGTAPGSSYLLGIPMGLFAAAILVANNLRDIHSDGRAGKRTLAVMIGEPRTRRLYQLIIGAAFGCIATFAAADWTPLPTAIACFWLPLAAPLLRTASGAQSADLIPLLKGTVRLQLVVAMSLAAGAAL